MDKIFSDVFNLKVIYVFRINDDAHKGLLKIGDATVKTTTSIDKLPPNCKELNQAALKRIRAYTNTAGLTPQLLHTEVAVKTIHDKEGNVTIKAFRDHDVHNVLINSNIPKKKIGQSTGQEWFKIDLQTAQKAIEAVKDNIANLSNSGTIVSTPIILRPEQEECVTKVVKHFKKADRFLINAKMRYGKTLVALEIIKQCQFKKTIIITHRPVVNDGWYEDFTKIFQDKKDYVYGSKANGYTATQLLNGNKNFVYFASVQDLRGSSAVGGKFDKNDAIFNTLWDCVVVDEAHEGTTTVLGDDTIKAIIKEKSGTKLLALSGTPFNILCDYSQDSIYTWDYVMEQSSKYEWDDKHFGDSNPYDELPELKIYTYDLSDMASATNFVSFEDKAFNFHEFFRTWTGDFSVDYADMPPSAHDGDFVHEADILSFLNLMTKEDAHNMYPFSNPEYRDLFKHSLWMVPGVKAAKALKKLMLKHPVFGNGMFDIVNVAGNGDEEEKSEEALKKVRKAIKDAGDGNYTITLSCGKLTTGVTVKEWTAVFMLSGSANTGAANYLQTIFRVQSPCNQNGRIKETAYVFDFAPDRTLKMVASAVSISSKAGKTTGDDKKILGKFLNYCPVIAISGSKMHEYNTNKLLQQLKRAYAERVVRNGFDDNHLYSDELLKLQDVDIQKFDELKKIIGKSNASPKSNDITVNDQGLTDEEYEEQEKLKKKKKRELTDAEKERLKKLKEKKKLRADAISILRGISIRMPLLIFGAQLPYDEDITLDKFVKEVDVSSWEEFMPSGVTKRIFGKFRKYYDEEVFIAAGRQIRNVAMEADQLDPTERVKKIASLFSQFKNPDKETILTPWRVVNMHMSDCIGGWDFWDEGHNETLEEPRFVDRDQVTTDIFKKPDAQILEINSKTGLYPLYVAYSIYRQKCEAVSAHLLTLAKKNELWTQAVQDNVFIICNTLMAKAITQRTLMGYKAEKINAHYFDDLVNTMKNKPQHFIDKIQKELYWKKGSGNMKFDAVVGNPPYQEETNGAGRQAKPVYNYFVEQAKNLNPHYVSMITPSRWFSGGMGLDKFRDNMIKDNKLIKIKDYTNAKNCFPQISIGGGVNYFLWDNDYNGECIVENIHNGNSNTSKRSTGEFTFFVRYNSAVSILQKILFNDILCFESMDSIISPLMPFGLSTNYRGRSQKSSEDILSLYASTGVTFIRKEEIAKGLNYINKYKVMISKMGAEHAGEPDKNGMFGIFTKSMKVLVPGEVCTHSYFLIGAYNSKIDAINTLNYLKTKFVRFIVMTTLSAVNLSKLVFANVPLQDFTDSSDIDWSKDISEIDRQLYAKYNLSEEEITFIESMIKPMA